MATKRPQPTGLELTILKALWNTGPSSVRDLQAVLNESRPTGYTTVLKMLQIMTEKGLVKRDESVRPQIYRPAASQEQTQRRLLRDLVDRAYGGSVKSLVLQALSDKKASPKEIDAIEKLLDRVEGEDK
jgi:BlaI family penicillinase repressor